MAGQDIFANQEVAGGQTATTAMQGIPDDSKAIRNQALSGLGGIAEAIGKIKNVGDDAKDTALNNLQKSMTNLAEARIKGKYTDLQAEYMKTRIAQRFADDNPHLREDINKAVKDMSDTYKFIGRVDQGGSDQQQAQIDSEKKIYQGAIENRHIAPGETDPAKIAMGIQSYQMSQTYQEQAKIAADKVALANAELTNMKLKNDVANQPLQNQMLQIEATTKTAEFEGKKALSGLVDISLQRTSGLHNNILSEIQTSSTTGGPSDQDRIRWIRSLDEDTADTVAKAQAIAQSPFVDKASIDAATAAVVTQNNKMKSLILQEQDLNVLQNTAKLYVETSKVGIFSSSNGPEAVTTAALVDIFGPNSITYTNGTVQTIQQMAKDQVGVTPNGVPIFHNLYSSPNNSNATLVMDSLTAAAARSRTFSQSTPNTPVSKEADKVVDRQLESIFASAGTGGEITPGSASLTMEKLGSPDVNAYAVRVGKFNLPESTIRDARAIFAKAYSDPVLKSFGAQMQSKGATGKSLAELTQPTIQNGKVVLMPRQGLSPQEADEARAGITTLSKYMDGVTNIVRADATMHNSDDFRSSLQVWAPKIMGIEVPKEATPNSGAAPTTEGKQNKYQKLDSSTTSNAVPDNTTAPAPTIEEAVAVASDPAKMAEYDAKVEQGLIEEMRAQKYSDAAIEKAVTEQRARIQKAREDAGVNPQASTQKFSAQPYDVNAKNQVDSADGGVSDVTRLGGATGTEFNDAQRAQLAKEGGAVQALADRGLAKVDTSGKFPPIVQEPVVGSDTYAEDQSQYIDHMVDKGSYLNIQKYAKDNFRDELTPEQQKAVQAKLEDVKSKYDDTEEYLRHSSLRELMTINDDAYASLSDSEKSILTSRLKEEFVRPDGVRLAKYLFGTAMGSDAVEALLGSLSSPEKAAEVKANAKKMKEKAPLGKA